MASGHTFAKRRRSACAPCRTSCQVFRGDRSGFVDRDQRSRRRNRSIVPENAQRVGPGAKNEPELYVARQPSYISGICAEQLAADLLFRTPRHDEDAFLAVLDIERNGRFRRNIGKPVEERLRTALRRDHLARGRPADLADLGPAFFENDILPGHRLTRFPALEDIGLRFFSRVERTAPVREL